MGHQDRTMDRWFVAPGWGRLFWSDWIVLRWAVSAAARAAAVAVIMLALILSLI